MKNFQVISPSLLECTEYLIKVQSPLHPVNSAVVFRFGPFLTRRTEDPIALASVLYSGEAGCILQLVALGAHGLFSNLQMSK